MTGKAEKIIQDWLNVREKAYVNFMIATRERLADEGYSSEEISKLLSGVKIAAPARKP